MPFTYAVYLRLKHNKINHQKHWAGLTLRHEAQASTRKARFLGKGRNHREGKISGLNSTCLTTISETKVWKTFAEFPTSILRIKLSLMDETCRSRDYELSISIVYNHHNLLEHFNNIDQHKGQNCS